MFSNEVLCPRRPDGDADADALATVQLVKQTEAQHVQTACNAAKDLAAFTSLWVIVGEWTASQNVRIPFTLPSHQYHGIPTHSPRAVGLREVPERRGHRRAVRRDVPRLAARRELRGPDGRRARVLAGVQGDAAQDVGGAGHGVRASHRRVGLLCVRSASLGAVLMQV